MDAIRFREIEHRSAQYDSAVALRDAVLRAPLGMRITREDQDTEVDCRHVALLDDDTVLATVVAVPLAPGVMRIRQMAVHPEHRDRGLGRALLDQTEAVLREAGVRQLILHARDTAIGFYRRCGYHEEGEPFPEIGLRHQRMVKSL